MKTIVEGQSQLQKVWGKQKPQQIAYRLMKYTLLTDCEDGELLHNIISGRLVLLSPAESEVLKKLPAVYTDEMQELVENHFLVPVDYDEKKVTLQLRKLLLRLNPEKTVSHFTILPTTGCNARCFYCYESDFKHVSMTEETAHSVVEYICSHCPNEKPVYLRWFGGEPLVGMNRIDQICNELKDRGYQYYSSMISNAYLFDEAKAKKAKELWHLGNIQITLDGTEEIYNKTKAYVGISGSPFQRVLNNIGYLLDNKIAISVRLNLGRHNEDDLYSLIDQLAQRFAGRAGFSVYVGVLFNDEGFEPVHHSEIDREELILRRVALEKHIAEKNCKVSGKNNLPSMTLHHCMADSLEARLISPSGMVGKCEHYVFEKLVGDIHSSKENEEMLAEWAVSYEWKKCDQCSLFPECLLLKNCADSEECRNAEIAYKKSIYCECMKRAYVNLQNRSSAD